ncbi:MAG: tRNA (adenosine(37)-N6)-dimethylallyltransferase MiaA, partial [Propionibacteriaceae bacterium]|nr:tRNA (adenosine(37)-N6)-dimethylallyltransferase MiaA [Propionibacteriaceae bacterium]
MIPVIVLAGATATGKSAFAVDLALWFRGRGQAAEVVNADSMLQYRGMDIGTAKPSLAERRGVRHHLIDIMDVAEPASVAVFQSLARTAITDCRARGAVPILVGGSALYLHAVIDAFDFPPTDPVIRARLTAEVAERGTEPLYSRLAAQSPETARGIDPGNARRIVRALEAIELTGEFTPSLPDWTYAIPPVTQLGLAITRSDMDARIAARVEAMWRAGFVDEVRGLLEGGLRGSPTAARAIGYRQIIAYLDGTMTADEAKESTVIRTRQFARKQLAWWRRDPRLTWLPAGTPVAGVAAALGLTPSGTLGGDTAGGLAVSPGAAPVIARGEVA